MRKHSLLVSAAMIFTLARALATVAMAANPFVGTWRLNLGKSNPGTGYKSATVKIEALDNGLNIVTDGVNADGKANHSEGTEILDGKDYANPSNPGRTEACTRVDANTVVVVFKRDGKELGRSFDVVSKDGRTITRTLKGKNAKGQEINNAVVFNKQ